jgi:NADH dehydrogenase
VPAIPNTPSSQRPKVVVIGGGFGGIAVAKRLAKTPVDVVLIDQKNHHVFQPLLYQVATAVLSPVDIAAPIRRILSRQKNAQVILSKVTGIDLASKKVSLESGEVRFDWLVIAAGATHSYFGNTQWESVAPGLKSIEDATVLRRKILLAFERAEYEPDEKARKADLTFAIVGGGPTGVELAGAIKEIAAKTIVKEFRNIDTRMARVILVEGLDRILPQMREESSDSAKQALEAMGVEVMTKTRVTQITEEGLSFGEEFLPVKNVFWAAGVQASSLGQYLGVPLERNGRVIVGPDLSVPENPNVFVIGDMASAKSVDTGKPVPGVAQGAMQMGKFVGELIRDEVKTGARIGKGFSYFDKGTMATIGRSRAVAEIGKYNFSGFLAWLLWSGLHVAYLITFRNRIAVMIAWIFQWFASDREVRLITGESNWKSDKKSNWPTLKQ